MEGTVIWASRADALVTRAAGIADKVGEDTGVGGATATGDTDFCTLPAAGFEGGGLAGLADFAATLTGAFAAGFTAGFFAGTGFLAAAFGLVFAAVLVAGFFTPAFFAGAFFAATFFATGLGLAADLAVGFTGAPFLGAALTVLDTAGLALADLTLDGRDDTDLADLAFT